MSLNLNSSYILMSSMTYVTGFVEIFWFVCLMVFNATFNNISVISWQSVLLEESGGPGENHQSVASC